MEFFGHSGAAAAAAAAVAGKRWAVVNARQTKSGEVLRHRIFAGLKILQVPGMVQDISCRSETFLCFLMLGGGSRSGGSFRQVGVGHFGSRPDGSSPSYRGRGRGRSHAGRFSSPAEKPASFRHEASSQTPGQSPQYVVGPELAPTSVSAHALRTSVWPPPRMAWCELCRVDCNTPEILEQHKNGKKHKKNLQVYEEFQKLNELLVRRRQTEQVPVPEVNQEVDVQPEKVERSEDKLASQEDLSSQAGTDENKVESEQQMVSETAASEEETRKPGMDCFEVRGSKRKMRGGRGGKWMRTHEGSRRSVEPPKPKQAVSLSCELCNVKCESEVVFQSHLNGKKHLSNLKRFQGQQAILEQAALQVLYPALLQALGPPNPNASTSYAPQYHQEGVHGFQGFTPQQLAPQIFLPGQVSAPPAKTSASASSSGLQIQDHQDPKPEQSQAMSEAWSQDAAAVEAKSKPEAEPGDTVQTVT
ncbi:uncharacterized protein LOC127802065 isoform X2 [Diospyros lotus]|uniref:uncharacterized protein LOC127802065 isoform X2 n=2 Tax=Diospyros lotus TaxID=55363 RepID=UPI0022587B61|nr:uncharacterized protein LOC127802065 isoform X2 [Diospyros lotus]